MTQKIHVQPVTGRAVPDPARGDLLPSDGRQVAPSPYWTRCESAGDVTIKPVTAKVAPKEGK